jgi:hypothetical protein
VSFDKIFVFCGKFCVHSNKCVSIVVKIKCVNSSNISDICDKLNITTNHIHFTITKTHFIKTHTKLQFFTFLRSLSRHKPKYFRGYYIGT